MTDSRDPFDLLRADLEQAAARSRPEPAPPARRRRRVRRPALALVAVLALAGTIVVSTDLGADGPDVVAEAAAALEPGDGVLHMVLDGGPLTRGGRPAPEVLPTDGGRTLRRLTRRTEQWSTTSPLRFRSRRVVIDPRTGARDTTSFGLQSTDPDTGTAWTDDSWDREPARTSTVEGLAPRGDVAEAGALRTADPAAQIRSQLRAGTFVDDGTVTRDGTTLRRLVATITGKAARGGDGGYVPDRRLVYLVDPDTSTPRAFETLERAPADADVPARLKSFAPSERFTISTYERLPLDDRTRALFAVPGRARR